MTNLTSNAALVKNYHEALLSAARSLFAAGYSVVPVIGGAGKRAKSPSIVWKHWRGRVPLEVVEQALAKGGGLALVMGYEGLVCIDLDSVQAQDSFYAEFGEYLDTWAELTPGRKGLHLFYWVSDPGVAIGNRAGGVDVKSSGIVLAAPTLLASGAYVRIGKAEALALPAQVWSDMRHWAAALGALPREPAKVARELLPAAADGVPFRGVNEAALRASYDRSVVAFGGRNEGLFKACLWAHGRGASEALALAMLLPLHVARAPLGEHESETIAEREAEARRTIKSAFGYPARASGAAVPADDLQMDNSIREALLGAGSAGAAVVRLYEAAVLLGVRPGDRLSIAQYAALVGGVVGRDSVRAALAFQVGDRRVFEKISLSPCPPNPTSTCGTDSTLQEVDSMLFKTCLNHDPKSAKSKMARHLGSVFAFPSLDQLAALLGVPRSVADVLELDDLSSSRALRLALHVRLIRRCPGQYLRQFQADRLGVSRSTVRRYDKLGGVDSMAVFSEVARFQFEDQCEALPEYMQVKPERYFLELRSRRWPARVDAARWLVKTRGFVVLKRREANLYWIGGYPPLELIAGALMAGHPDIVSAVAAARWRGLPVPDSARLVGQLSVAALPVGKSLGAALSDQKFVAKQVQAAFPELVEVKRPKRLPVVSGRRRLPDESAERLARSVQEAVGRRGDVVLKDALSLARVRLLVHQYGVSVVRDVFSDLRRQQISCQIVNPSGWFVTACRVHWRAAHPGERIPALRVRKRRGSARSAASAAG